MSIKFVEEHVYALIVQECFCYGYRDEGSLFVSPLRLFALLYQRHVGRYIN